MQSVKRWKNLYKFNVSSSCGAKSLKSQGTTDDTQTPMERVAHGRTSASSSERKLSHETLVIFASLLVSAAALYLFRVLVIRQVDVVSAGIFFGLLVLFRNVNTLRDWGLGYYALERLAHIRVFAKRSGIWQVLAQVMAVQTVTCIVLSAVLLAFWPWINALVFQGHASYWHILFVVGLLVVSILEGGAQLFFQGMRLMGQYALENVVKNVMILLLFITGALLMLGSAAPFLAYLGAMLIAIVIFAIIAWRAMGRQDRAHLTVRESARIWFKNNIVMLAILLMIALGSIDTLIVSAVLGVGKVTAYAAAVTIALLLTYFSQAIVAAMLPRVPQAHKEGKNDLFAKMLGSTRRALLLILIPLVVFVCIESKTVIAMVFGQSVADAGPALMVLGVAMLFSVFSEINTQVLLGRSEAKRVVKFMLLGLVIDVILNVILLPVLGILGAAIAALISYAVTLILSTKEIKELYNIQAHQVAQWQIPKGALLFAIVLTVGIGLLAQVVISTGVVVIDLVLHALIIGGWYLILILLLRIVTAQELIQMGDVRGLFKKEE